MAARPPAPKAAPNPLLNPGAPLQGQGLQQAAQSLTDAQTKGPLTELAKQIAFNNRQGAAAQKLTAGQFNTLGQYGKQAVANEGTIANDLNTQLQGISNDTSSRLAQSAFGAGANIMAHAPGGSSNPAQSPALQGLAQTYAQQQGNAANDAGAYRSFGATQGANYRGLAAANQGVYSLKGQEALKGIAQATRLSNEPINQKVADLQAQRGALLATNEGKLRQQEIQNRVTSAGLGLNAQKLAATVQQNQASNQLRAAGINATIRGQDLAHLDRTTSNQLRALSSSFGGLSSVLKAANQNTTSTALPVTKQHQAYNTIDRISDVVRGLKRNGSTPQQITRFLVYGGKFSNKSGNFQSPGYPQWAVQAAYDMATYGYINAKDQAQLQKHGLSLPNYYPVR